MEAKKDSFKDRFTYVYDNDVWGGNFSGGGSCPEFLTKYFAFFNEFTKANNIKTVIDFGCGVSDFSHRVDLTGIKYTGVDIVNSVIEHNQKFANDNISYKLINDVNEIESMQADLLILKDILQHWNYDEIESFLSKYKDNFKYIFIINISGQKEDYEYYAREPHLYGIKLNHNFKPLSNFNPEFVMLLDENPNDIKELSIIKNVKQ